MLLRLATSTTLWPDILLVHQANSSLKFPQADHKVRTAITTEVIRTIEEEVANDDSAKEKIISENSHAVQGHNKVIQVTLDKITINTKIGHRASHEFSIKTGTPTTSLLRPYYVPSYDASKNNFMSKWTITTEINVSNPL